MFYIYLFEFKKDNTGNSLKKIEYIEQKVLNTNQDVELECKNITFNDDWIYVFIAENRELKYIGLNYGNFIEMKSVRNFMEYSELGSSQAWQMQNIIDYFQ